MKSAAQVDTLVPPRPEQNRPRFRLRIVPGRGKLRSHQFATVGPLDTVHATFVAFGNTFRNALSALQERVFYREIPGHPGVYAEPPAPLQNIFHRRLRRVRNSIFRTLPRVVPYTWPAFVAAYVGRQRQVYEHALQNILAGTGVPQLWARIKAFVKWEKLPLGNKRLVPRLIQPRCPEYNILVGCYLKPMEHVLYEGIATAFLQGYWNGKPLPVVMKGYNAFDSGDILHESWCRYRHPACLGLDASRFDEHVSYDALSWEHQVWLHMCPPQHRAELAQLLQLQLINSGACYTPEGGLKYVVPGRRMSGDMNTGSGNCYLMCSMVKAMLAHFHCHANIHNNGDDVVLIGEADDLNRLAPNIIGWFVDFGFTMKVEPIVYQLEQLEFCQTHPVFDGHQWRMVRNCPSSLVKDATIVHPLPGGYIRDYLATLGQCGLALCSGMPILQSYYSAMLSTQGKVKPHLLERCGMTQLAHGLQAKVVDISTEARVSFWRAFGILPDIQVELERYYSTLQLETITRGPRVMAPKMF